MERGVQRKHVERLRVRYGDTDQMGVVYYANYLRWFEQGRAEWLRAGGILYRDLEAAGSLFPVIEAHVRYRQPARYDDELDLEVRVARAGAASLRFEYELRKVEDGQLLAEGWTEHACVDKSGRPKRLPEVVRGLLGV